MSVPMDPGAAPPPIDLQIIPGMETAVGLVILALGLAVIALLCSLADSAAQNRKRWWK